MKKANAAHDVTVVERNAADDTFGWGVVFSDQTMENFRAGGRRDVPGDHGPLRALGRHRRPRQGRDDHVGRPRLQRHRAPDAARRFSQRRATALGVDLRFRTEFSADDSASRDRTRRLRPARRRRRREQRHPAAVRRRTSGPRSTSRRAKYIWLGTTRLFDAFTFAFVENEYGVFQAHAYRFDEKQSAFIVECDERRGAAPASTA